MGISQEPLALARVALVLTLPFYETDNTITADYTIGTNKNAMSVGDIEVATGVTVTVPTGSFWVVV
jgi:hypothetical protein